MAADISFGFGPAATSYLATSRVGQGFIRAYAKVYNSKYNKALVGTSKQEIKVGGTGATAATPDEAAIAQARQRATNTKRVGSSKPEVQKPVFPNQLSSSLKHELEQAARVGAVPLRFADEGFEVAINSGTVKYVVTESGEVLIIPHTVNGIEISHAVLTNGQPVLAAGQADIAGANGSFIGISITNHSGHFQTTLESLRIAREAFAKLGITFP